MYTFAFENTKYTEIIFCFEKVSFFSRCIKLIFLKLKTLDFNDHIELPLFGSAPYAVVSTPQPAVYE